MSTVSGGRRRAFRSRHHTPMGEGGKLAVIFVSIALILFVLAVMLGNHLRGLAEEIIDETTDAETTEAEIYYANVPSNVVARGILFGTDYSVSGETVAETADRDATDTAPIVDPVEFDSISVVLRKKDRESGETLLAYFSPISLEYSIDRVGSTDLEAGIELIKDNWGERTPLCGIFEVDHLNRPEASREIMRAYEIALLCELIDAGVEEIMLLGFSNSIDEGLAFISDVYEQKGRGTAIGLALSFDFINSVNARSEISEITKKCGFLALDLYSPEVPALMSPESMISDRVSRSLDICREFSIRVLLGCGNEPDCESQSRFAIDAGAKNLMTGLGVPRGTSDNTEITN